MSLSPRIAATIEVATSGSDVPTETIVRPMISSLNPAALAIVAEADTSQRAPNISNARPPSTRSPLNPKTYCFSADPSSLEGTEMCFGIGDSSLRPRRINHAI